MNSYSTLRRDTAGMAGPRTKQTPTGAAGFKFYTRQREGENDILAVEGTLLLLVLSATVKGK